MQEHVVWSSWPLASSLDHLPKFWCQDISLPGRTQYLDEVESKAGRLQACMNESLHCMQPVAVELPVYDCWMIDWLIVSCVMLDLLI